jgi:hypothetical protein
MLLQMLFRRERIKGVWPKVAQALAQAGLVQVERQRNQ